MATLVIETLVDDLDGSAAAETVTFALDQETFEIDLSKDNAAKLRDKLAKFIEAAQPVRAPKVKRITKQIIRTPSSKEQTAAIRSWGRANGWDVSGRGRVPTALLDAFNDAH